MHDLFNRYDLLGMNYLVCTFQQRLYTMIWKMFLVLIIILVAFGAVLFG